jgi:hypothetical protein
LNFREYYGAMTALTKTTLIDFMLVKFTVVESNKTNRR